MAILELRAARGLSIEETAKRFLVEPATIAEWMRRVDEEGSSALVQTDEPVNRFPDFVRWLVRRLKVLCPTFGKKRIAQILSRAGIHLGVTTVGRMLKERERKPKPSAEDAVESEIRSKWKPVIANYSDHVWQIDLTLVPTMAGFWTAWLPFSVLQVWPFCWWVAFVVDHYSRRVMGFTVWTKEPTSRDVRTFLGHIIATTRAAPKYVLSDKGRQFDCRAFKAWCDRKGIQPRYASTGKQTRATAIVERFVRSVKEEWLRSSSVPFRRDDMRNHIACSVAWFHEWRPHQGLGGRTPNEGYDRKTPANTKPRIELRPRWPRGSPCAEPQARVTRRKVSRLTLSVKFVDGHRQLPVVEVKIAA
jgi:transposase InsO family protein